MREYIAIFRKSEANTYGVDFPDVPGCISFGDTLEDAIRNAAEALTLHLHGLAEDQDPLPSARSLAEIVADQEAEAEGHTLMPIREVAGLPIKKLATRVNFTIDPNLLAKADAFARAHGHTRSSLIALGLQKVLSVS